MTDVRLNGKRVRKGKVEDALREMLWNFSQDKIEATLEAVRDQTIDDVRDWFGEINRSDIASEIDSECRADIWGGLFAPEPDLAERFAEYFRQERKCVVEYEPYYNLECSLRNFLRREGVKG